MTQLFHARKIAVWLHIVGQIDNLFQKRHIRTPGRMPIDRVADLSAFPKNTRRNRRAGLGVQEFPVFFFKTVPYDTTFFA